VIVDRFDARDAVHPVAKIRGLRLRALHAEHDVVGRERRSVMEARPLAQVELPMGRVEDLPARSELRHDRQVGIDIEQRLVDLVGRSPVFLGGKGVGIHRGGQGVQARKPQHVLGRGRVGNRKRREHRQAGEQ
jgi:hypothetical protein